MTTPGRRVGRIGRAVAAAVALVALVAGVPALMVGLDLIPHRVPGASELWQIATSRDTGQVALFVIAAGVWICWALFTISLVTELAALLRRMPSPSLPGLAVFQKAAAGLLTSIVIGLNLAAVPAMAQAPLPAQTAAVTVASAVASPEAEVAATSIAMPDAAPRHVAAEPVRSAVETTESDATIAYRVQPRDTLWGIAEAHLGGGSHYPEIIAANPGRIAPDNEIIAGTVLRLPERADAPASHPPTSDAQTVTVQPGDTLSEIAYESGSTWQELWQANEGKPAPGGRVFTDPNLIWPGQEIVIPADTAAATSEPATAPPAGTPQSDAPQSDETEPSTAPRQADTAAAVDGSAGAANTAGARTDDAAHAARPRDTAADAVEAEDPSPTSATTTDSHAGADIAADSDETSQSWPGWVLAGAGVPLLAGALFLAWSRLRRRQRRWRLPGDPITLAPAAAREAERALRTAGPQAVDTVTRLDRALRSLVTAVRAGIIGELPQLVSATVDTDGTIGLRLARVYPDVPAPWKAFDGQATWVLAADAQPVFDEADRPVTLAPYPMLASVGHDDDGRQYLVDLEQIGGLAITGPADRSADLMRYMAAELAHNTWSEMLKVTCYGLGDEVASIGPDRVEIADASSLAATAASATSAINLVGKDREAGVDVLTARAAVSDREVPAPQVFLVAAPDGALAIGRVQQLTVSAAGRTAVAVVTCGDTPGGTAMCRAVVDEDGTLRIGMLGISTIAQSMPASDAAELGALMAAARATGSVTGEETGDAAATDTAAIPVDTDEAWTAATGAAAADGLPLPAAGVGESGIDTLAGHTDQVQDALPTSNVVSIAAADRPIDARADTLDADLADWLDPHCARPKIRLLGPVTVAAAGSLPDGKPRLAWHTEVVALLACRPSGLTAEKLSTALWPNEPYVPGRSRVRQAAATVRRWLGTDPDTGEPFLPTNSSATEAVYRLDGALTDADLFVRLRSRSASRGESGATDLAAALGLVTGIPFDQRRAGGYGWLADDPLDEIYAAMIVDAAHELAEHYLAAGNPRDAADAAKVALAAGSCEDTPLLDLAAACDAQGMGALRNEYIRRILTNHAADVEEDLPPATYAVLNERGWLAVAS